MQHSFAHRPEVARRDLQELFRVARRPPIVGLAVLGRCLAASSLVGALGTEAAR